MSPLSKSVPICISRGLSNTSIQEANLLRGDENAGLLFLEAPQSSETALEGKVFRFPSQSIGGRERGGAVALTEGAVQLH